MKKLTRIDALKIISNAIDRDDPHWEYAVENFYDSDTDTLPTIFDVLHALGISAQEIKDAGISS